MTVPEKVIGLLFEVREVVPAIVVAEPKEIAPVALKLAALRLQVLVTLPESNSVKEVPIETAFDVVASERAPLSVIDIELPVVMGLLKVKLVPERAIPLVMSKIPKVLSPVPSF